MKIEDRNHFICILTRDKEHCPVNFFGQPMCEVCKHVNKCENCGKLNTTFCERCTVKGDNNNK